MTVENSDILAWLKNVYTDFEGVVTSVNTLDLEDSHELALTLIGLLDGMVRTQEINLQHLAPQLYEGMPDDRRVAAYEEFLTTTYIGVGGLKALMRGAEEHDGS